MNSLEDKDMIDALYRASEAGVKIDLIIRGICRLVPNQPYSENITVTRIVDAYLEHSRVWYFYNAGREDVYLASADWMERNLRRRIETAFPILSEPLKRQVIDISLTCSLPITKAPHGLTKTCKMSSSATIIRLSVPNMPPTNT